MKCGICNQEFDTFRKIARHIKDKHKMSTKDYYDKFINSLMISLQSLFFLIMQKVNRL